MSRRWMPAVFIAAVLVPAAALALRDPIATSGGPDLTGVFGCIAYAHENLTGTQRFYGKGDKARDVTGEGFSSIACHSDCTMTTFTQGEFQGSRKHWRGALLYVGDVWNDRIASLTVSCEEPQAQAPPPKPADPVLVPIPSTGGNVFAPATDTATAPSAAEPPKPIKKLGKSATVIADIDVYDAPGGSGNVVGMLRSGGKVGVGSWPCADNWCDVSGDAVPGGKGWVYSGPDYESLKR